MNIDQHYEQIIERISRGERGLVRYSPEELEELEGVLNTDPGEKVLCLIEHSAAPHSAFEGPLLKLLVREDFPDQLKVFALNCARKHIIQSRQQRGQRQTFELLEALKKLLYSKSPEVVEWTLRTIEEIGPQGIYFLSDFAKLKPPPWKWFNPHQRAVRELIELLIRRWKRAEKLQS